MDVRKLTAKVLTFGLLLLAGHMATERIAFC